MKALLCPLLPIFFLAAPAVAGDYLIENANVLPMTEEVVLEGHSVRVQGGRIAEICEPGRACGDGGTETIDGRGKFLIPGLTDMHAHTNPGENAAMEVAQREMVRRIQSQQLRQYVMFGVTTIRDPAGGPRQPAGQGEDSPGRNSWSAAFLLTGHHGRRPAAASCRRSVCVCHRGESGQLRARDRCCRLRLCQGLLDASKGNLRCSHSRRRRSRVACCRPCADAGPHRVRTAKRHALGGTPVRLRCCLRRPRGRTAAHHERCLPRHELLHSGEDQGSCRNDSELRGLERSNPHRSRQREIRVGTPHGLQRGGEPLHTTRAQRLPSLFVRNIPAQGSRRPESRTSAAHGAGQGLKRCRGTHPSSVRTPPRPASTCIRNSRCWWSPA